MEISLYKQGYPYPIRHYESTYKALIQKERARWIKDVKNLNGTYYIEVKDAIGVGMTPKQKQAIWRLDYKLKREVCKVLTNSQEEYKNT